MTAAAVSAAETFSARIASRRVSERTKRIQLASRAVAAIVAVQRFRPGSDRTAKAVAEQAEKLADALAVVVRPTRKVKVERDGDEN